MGSGLSVGAWLCFTILTSPVDQGIRRNSSGGCDHDGIFAALCSQAAWVPRWKKTRVCAKRKASQLGPLANPGQHLATGSDEHSGLWEKLFQGNVPLDDAYWDQAGSPDCLQENWGCSAPTSDEQNPSQKSEV